MEGKGKKNIDIFGDEKGTGILPDIHGGKGVFSDTMTGFMRRNSGILTQVPSDEQIKELLKGKTAEEKKQLLREIEKARQAKIHMTYLMEQ